MNNKNILIFGGLGFIGNNLAERLYKKNMVYILDKNKKKKIIHPNIKIIKSSIEDLKKYRNILKKIDYIFHFAGYVGKNLTQKESELIIKEINSFYSISKIFEINPKIKLVYASSCQVYGINKNIVTAKESDPLLSNTSYGISKIIAEFFLKDLSRRYSLPIACLRFFNVYGPGQSRDMAIPNFINKAKKNLDIIIHGNGSQVRDFLYIDDCIDVVIKVAKKIKRYEVFNVPGAENINIKNLVKLIKDLTNSKSKVIYTKIDPGSQIVRSVGDKKKLITFIKIKPSISLKDGIVKVINE